MGPPLFLLLIHLSQEHKHCRAEGDKGVSKHPPKVREDARKVTDNERSLHINRVYEWERVRNLFECAAHKLEIKPNAR